jgi:hypothetical protein
MALLVEFGGHELLGQHDEGALTGARPGRLLERIGLELRCLVL